MAKVQVIVRKGDRVWDSVRQEPKLAFARIAEYMKQDHEDSIVTIGGVVLRKLIFNKPVVPFLESQDFEVTVKELE